MTDEERKKSDRIIEQAVARTKEILAQVEGEPDPIKRKAQLMALVRADLDEVLQEIGKNLG